MANISLPDDGFVRLSQICGQPGVTEEEANRNREALAEAFASGNAKALKRAQNRPVRARPATPGIMAVSRSTWWNGVRSGKYPAPVKLGPNITAWRVADIRTLIDSLSV